MAHYQPAHGSSGSGGASTAAALDAPTFVPGGRHAAPSGGAASHQARPGGSQAAHGSGGGPSAMDTESAISAPAAPRRQPNAPAPVQRPTRVSESPGGSARRPFAERKKANTFEEKAALIVLYISEVGVRLRLPQLTMATADYYFHRFYREYKDKHDRFMAGTACLFLAGKVEETPKKIKDVVLHSYYVRYSRLLEENSPEFYSYKKQVLKMEKLLLQTVGFSFHVEHPYQHLLQTIKAFSPPSEDGSKTAASDLAQLAWNFVNDSLRTNLCLEVRPRLIAFASIYLACKVMDRPLDEVKVDGEEGTKKWWEVLGVDRDVLVQLGCRMLDLYDENSKMSRDEVIQKVSRPHSAKRLSPVPRALPANGSGAAPSTSRAATGGSGAGGSGAGAAPSAASAAGGGASQGGYAQPTPPVHRQSATGGSWHAVSAEQHRARPPPPSQAPPPAHPPPAHGASSHGAARPGHGHGPGQPYGSSHAHASSSHGHSSHGSSSHGHSSSHQHGHGRPGAQQWSGGGSRPMQPNGGSATDMHQQRRDSRDRGSRERFRGHGPGGTAQGSQQQRKISAAVRHAPY